MAVLPYVGEMEDTGVAIDLELQKTLSVEYNKKLKEVEEKFYEALQDYQDEIKEYRYSQGSACKLPEK